MADISLTINWDQDTLRNQSNMNSNDNALIAGLSDGSKDIAVNQITPAVDLVGNASTMEKLSTPSTITLTGECTASVSFDGSAEANLNVTNTKGIGASCGITFGISKSVEEVLQNHSTDVDLDGNNTMTTWGTYIRDFLASPSSLLSTMFDNSTRWGYFSTTPLSSAENTIMTNNIHYELTNSSNITSISATDLTANNENPIIINFDPSLGTDPHDYNILSSCTLPDMDDKFFWDISMLGGYTNMVGTPQYRMVLQRNDELNPTHLQAYFYKSPDPIPYGGHLSLGSDGSSWVVTYKWREYIFELLDRIAALKTTTPARGTQYDALDDALTAMPLGYRASRYDTFNELLIGYQVTYGTTLFPDTLIIPNVGGYTSPVTAVPSTNSSNYGLQGYPNYLRNKDQIDRIQAMETYLIANSIFSATDTIYDAFIKDAILDLYDNFTNEDTGDEYDYYSNSAESSLILLLKNYADWVLLFVCSQAQWYEDNPFYLPYKFNLILCRK